MPISRNRRKRSKSNQKTALNSNQLKARQSNELVRNEVTLYQGLIPSPEMMEAYKNVDPSIPLKIMEWTTSEGDHRRKIETRIVKDAKSVTIWNSIFGLVAVLVIAALAYLFMINGHSEDGRWIACTVIVSLAGVFVFRKQLEKRKK